MDEENELIGANAIAKAVGRSHREIIHLQLYENLPMYLQGGIWKLSKEKLKDWQGCRDRGEFYEIEKEEEPTKKTDRERKEEINEQLEELGAETLTYNNGLKKFEKALTEARS